MRILGFATEHDSGVAFVENGAIRYAANEERFNREKFTRAYPEEAFKAGKEFVPGFAKKIDRVAVGSKIHVSEWVGGWENTRSLVNWFVEALTRFGIDRFFFGTFPGIRITMLVMRLLQWKRSGELAVVLHRWGIYAPVQYVDHHTAHAASAYFTGPWQRALVITLDAQGDGMCSRVFLGENGQMRELHRVPFFHSPGHYYAYVTLMFGFKLGREGKVTGLAARGNYSKTWPIFKSRLSFDEERCTFINHGFYRHVEMAYLKEKLKGFSREDIAAGVQQHLEEVVTAYVSTLIKRYVQKPIPVVLAGGIFANVRLNQRVMDLADVTGVYIYPHMGDGGLAAGAALAVETSGHPLSPNSVHDVYLGPQYSDKEIEDALKKAGCAYKKSSQSAREVAEYLSKGKVVAVSRGRMEYGPRALGNRTIMYQTTDPTVNDWLNHRLNRNEFMPFAPILRKEHVGMYFKNWQKCEKALEFMTITLDATERCKNEAPAVVHVDGSARPQLALANVNPFVDEVLREYERLTNLRVLINTSFNMHEEPIVCTPDDSVRAFLQGGFDVLALGSYIIERPTNSH